MKKTHLLQKKVTLAPYFSGAATTTLTTTMAAALTASMTAIATTMLLVASGCSTEHSSESTATSTIDTAINQNVAEKTPNYLAKVGDQYITEDDMLYQYNKMTNATDQVPNQDKVKKNILEGLVLAKLMALTQEPQMTEQEAKALAADVKSYREERLVQQYIKNNVSAIPPSSKEVDDYYKKNPHRFGGGTFVNVEYWLLTKDCRFKQDNNVDGNSATNSTSSSTSSGTSSSSTNNPAKKAAALKTSLLNAGCKHSQTDRPTLLSDLEKMTGKAATDLHQGSYHWVRSKEGQMAAFIGTKEHLSAKPLVEVAPEIRKMLAPMQLKRAIMQVKEQLLSSINVEYF